MLTCMVLEPQILNIGNLYDVKDYTGVQVNEIEIKIEFKLELHVGQ